MNKEELKDEIKKIITVDVSGFKLLYRDDVEQLIDQLDEPEKVVIPQFVADYIEQAKKNDLRLQGALKPCDRTEPYNVDVRGWRDEEILNFSKAWIDGYTVGEKKYEIRNSFGEVILYKEGDKIKRTGDTYIVNENDIQFTEKEIKDYDERYWPFAEEVVEE